MIVCRVISEIVFKNEEDFLAALDELGNELDQTLIHEAFISKEVQHNIYEKEDRPPRAIACTDSYQVHTIRNQRKC